MATRPDSMGIYAGYAAKRKAKYDVELEGRCRDWIEGNLGRKLEGPTFRESLMDGVAVCDLINVLAPGTIKKIHKSPILMFRRENFGSFQRACLKLGCKEIETAVFEDVYDDKDMGQFLINIIALARNTQYQPGYKGPILPDAAKNSGQGKAVAATAAPYLGPTFTEQANKEIGENIKEGRYTEHGIVMDPSKNKKDPEPEKKYKYVGDYTDDAMRQAQEAKNDARYVEHGVIMDPSKNRKDAEPEKKYKYVGDYTDDAMRQAAEAKNDARYTEHGIIMDPSQNATHGKAPEQKFAYVGDYNDEAMKQAEKAKNDARYTEHGIIMDPSQNPTKK